MTGVGQAPACSVHEVTNEKDEETVRQVLGSTLLMTVADPVHDIAEEPE